MSGLFTFIGVVGLVGFIVALLALVRGRVRWARITDRKIAGIVLAASFCVFVTGSAIAGATSGTRPTNGAGAPAPVTTITVPPPTTTSATTTTSPPPVAPPTTTTAQPTTTTPPKPRPATTVPPQRTRTVPQPPPPPPPSISLTCAASMTNAQPADYSTTDVIVRTGVAGAQVTTTAHYKTTNTSHSAVASADGSADIAYRISDATIGYPVRVDVTVVAQGLSQSCTTSFTPQ